MWKRQNRKRKEFERVSLEHLDTLYGVALRLTRDEQNAEDLVQDTYVRALRFYERFEWGTNIRAWLLRIMTNTFINCYRRSQKEQQLVDDPNVNQTHEALLSNQAISQLQDPESQIMSGLLRAELSKAVEDLPDEFKVPIVLADVYGFSYREISEIQNCPIGTVMSRLHRARKGLQSKLLEQALASGYIKSQDQKGTTRGKLTNLNEYRSRRRAS